MMNLGQKFEEVLAQLERTEQAKKDVMLTKGDIKFDQSTGAVMLNGLGNVNFTRTGFNQFCNRFGMSARYAEKCLKRDPKMFAQHMEVWVGDYEDDKEMLFRTYDTNGKHRVRALLSDRYGILDNLPVVQELSKLADSHNLTVSNFGMSSDHADLRLVFPEMKQVIGKLNDGKTDDFVLPAIHIRNSETGLGKLTVNFAVYRIVCTNGMMAQRGSAEFFNRRHVGNMDVEFANILPRMNRTIETLPEIFAEYVEAMKQTKSVIYTNADEVVAKLIDRYSITKDQGERIAKAFNEEAGRTKHHIIQAITASARETKNWTERIQLETMAEKFLFDNVA